MSTTGAGPLPVSGMLATSTKRAAPSSAIGTGSPCVDAGDVFAVPADALDLDFDLDLGEPVPIALDGAARFVDVASMPDTGNGPAPVVDIGCYEQP